MTLGGENFQLTTSHFNNTLLVVLLILIGITGITFLLFETLLFGWGIINLIV
jgi:hypothetical protein